MRSACTCPTCRCCSPRRRLPTSTSSSGSRASSGSANADRKPGSCCSVTSGRSWRSTSSVTSHRRGCESGPVSSAMRCRRRTTSTRLENSLLVGPRTSSRSSGCSVLRSSASTSSPTCGATRPASCATGPSARIGRRPRQALPERRQSLGRVERVGVVAQDLQELPRRVLASPQALQNVARDVPDPQVERPALPRLRGEPAKESERLVQAPHIGEGRCAYHRRLRLHLVGNIPLQHLLCVLHRPLRIPQGTMRVRDHVILVHPSGHPPIRLQLTHRISPPLLGVEREPEDLSHSGRA